MKKHGLNQKINTITRPNRNGSSCLDLILTNCPFVKTSGTLDDFVSDHYTVYCIRKKAKENKECIMKTARNYRNYNQDNFENLLKGKDWNYYDFLVDPNLQWNFIYQQAIDILSIMCPYKTTPVRKTSTPWLTPVIFNHIHEKRNMVKKYKATRDQDLLREVRVLRNILNSEIDRAKSKYIMENLHRNCKNPKKFWQIINDFIKPDINSDISNVNFIDPVTGISIAPGNIPNYLNDYFVNIAEKTCDFAKVKYPTLNVNRDMNFKFEPPELDDIIYIIREIDNDMSSCVEGP